MYFFPCDSGIFPISDMVFYKAGCEYVVHSSTGCLDYRHIEMYFFPVFQAYFNIRSILNQVYCECSCDT